MRDRKFKTINKQGNVADSARLASWRKYYYDKHEYHITRNRKYYLERMIKWYEWFEELGYGECEICGFNEHPKAIDFHHRDPEEKVFGIGKFINGRQCNPENKEIVFEELKKCDCLCANCHRIHHFTHR